MKNRTLLLALAFVFAITPMIASTSAVNKETLKYTDSKDYFGVSGDQIYQYMLQFGFHVQTITPLGETQDVYVTTLEKRDFILHIQNGIIEGYDEAMM